MADATIRKLCRHKPAVRIILLYQFGVHAGDLAAQKPRRICQVTPVPQEIIGLPVSFWIAFRALRFGALDGTTTHHVAQHLATRGLQLTVLTNSPSISECLADAGGITHILLGGQLRRKSGGISGPLALEIVNQFAISTAFIGVSGITDEAITVADYNEAQLKAAIIKRTQKVIVPMDRSKVGFVDFARVCQPRDIDIIVTDSANEDLRRICKDNEIKLEEVSS